MVLLIEIKLKEIQKMINYMSLKTKFPRMSLNDILEICVFQTKFPRMLVSLEYMSLKAKFLMIPVSLECMAPKTNVPEVN